MHALDDAAVLDLIAKLMAAHESREKTADFARYLSEAIKSCTDVSTPGCGSKLSANTRRSSP
jgi:hypothetical protein